MCFLILHFIYLKIALSILYICVCIHLMIFNKILIKWKTKIPHSRNSYKIPHSRNSSKIPHSRNSSKIPHSRNSSKIPHSRSSSKIPHSRNSSKIHRKIAERRNTNTQKTQIHDVNKKCCLSYFYEPNPSLYVKGCGHASAFHMWNLRVTECVICIILFLLESWWPQPFSKKILDH